VLESLVVLLDLENRKRKVSNWIHTETQGLDVPLDPCGLQFCSKDAIAGIMMPFVAYFHLKSLRASCLMYETKQTNKHQSFTNNTIGLLKLSFSCFFILDNIPNIAQLLLDLHTLWQIGHEVISNAA